MIQKNNDNYYRAFFLLHIVLNLFCLDSWCEFMDIRWAIAFGVLTFVPIFLLAILSIKNKKDLLKVYITTSLVMYLPLLFVVISSWFCSIFSDTINCCILFATLFIVIGYLTVKIIKKEKVSLEEIEESDAERIAKNEKTKLPKEPLSLFSKTILAIYYLILACLIIIIPIVGLNDENGYRNDSYGCDFIRVRYYSCSNSSNACFWEKCMQRT